MEIRTKDSASSFYWHKPWAAISIAQHHGEWPWIQEQNRVGLLQIVIRDVKSEHDLFYGGSWGFCDKQKAIQIMDFVYGVWDRIDTLLVQCDHGSCASAITAALSRICDSSAGTYFHVRPNHLIYAMLLKAHYDRDGWRS
jgi:predicted protein tyrosine phosphatase